MKRRILAWIAVMCIMAAALPMVTLADATEATSETSAPLADSTGPTGEATEPTGEETEPTGEETEPTGEETEPTGEETEPTGEETEPTGEVTEPTGEETEPTGEVTEPTGEATEPTGEVTEPGTEPPDAGWPTGSCGSGITWVLNLTTGTLTISGSGAMDAGSHPGWMDYRTGITALVIGEGVTSISSSAFSGLTSLRTAKLPASLRRIGQNAFSGCSSLQMPELSDNLTTIDAYAFSDCGSITTLTVPAGVSVIGWGTFSGCSQLSRISFHSGVTELQDYAFSGCLSLTKITIPDSVTKIGGSAFHNCMGLREVTLGNGISTISNHMLGGCTGLQKLVIPDSVTTLDSYAFSGCSQLWDVTLGAGVSSVSTTAFNECRNLRTFKVSGSNPYLSADGGVLYNKSRAELILMAPGFSGSYSVLPGTKKIGEYACEHCYGLTGVTIPGSVTEIGKAAFRSCFGLVSVNLGYGVRVIGGEAFTGTPLTEVYFPASITQIGYFAFGNCSSLKKVTFAGSMPKFAESAFYHVTADGYHPGGDDSWSNVDDAFGDLYINRTLIDWKPTSCGGKHIPEAVPGVDATCTQEGLSEGSICAACGQVIQEQTVIPAAHSYGQWEEITPATEKSDGLARRSCTECAEAEEKVLVYTPPSSSVPAEPAKDGTEGQSQTPEVTEPPGKPAESTAAGEDTPVSSTEPSGTFPATEEPKEPESGENDAGAPEPSGEGQAVKIVGVLALVLLGGIGTAAFLQRRRHK